MSDLIKAYAKINLTLDIIGKREDGYHLLCMVMQSVSLYDEVKLSFGEPGIRVICSKDELSGSKNNTAYKAAELYFLHTGLKPNVTIHLKKNIPAQAGLGGGSADAAAVLNGLNKILDTKLSYETLCKIGLKVGADVPFCINGGTALAEGIGEKLTKLNDFKWDNILVIKPEFSMSTAFVYQNLPSDYYNSYLNNKILNHIFSYDYENTAISIANTLEKVVEKYHPEINRIKELMLKSGAISSVMTGSGSAIFAFFKDREALNKAYRAASQLYPSTFKTRTVKEGVKLID